MPVKNINLMGPNPAQPFDIQTEQARLAMAQQIAQGLIAEGLQPSSPVVHTGGGNPFARDVVNLAPLGKLGSAYLGKKGMEDTQSKQAQLAQIIAARNAEDTKNYMGLRFGGEEIPGSSVTDQGPQPPEYTKGNILKAISYGLGSQNPDMKKMAMEDMKGLPTAAEAMKTAHNLDPKGLAEFLSNPQDASVLRGRQTAQLHDNAIVSLQDGQQVGESKPVQTFKTKEILPGLPGSESQLTGEAKGIGGGTATAQESFEKVLNANLVKQLDEGKKEYEANVTKFQNVTQIREDLKGIPDSKFGTLADFRNAYNKLAELAGLPPDKTTSDVEALKSNLGKLLLTDIRAVAPVTKEDIKVIQDIVGTEGMTKRGLMRVMDVLEAATARDMGKHRAMVDKIPLPAGFDRDTIRSIYARDFKFTPLPATTMPEAAPGWGIKKLP